MPASQQYLSAVRQFGEAVGALILSFARLEGNLSMGLKLHLARSIRNDPKDTEAMGLASAIYGSMRLAASRDTMKRIMKVENTAADRVADVEAVFCQLGEVSKLRDLLAHQPCLPVEDDGKVRWLMCDLFTNRNIKDVNEYELTAELVQDATHDIVSAAIYFGAFERVPMLFQGESSPPAWRYKPSLLKPLPKNKQHLLEAVARQPQSWLEISPLQK